MLVWRRSRNYFNIALGEHDPPVTVGFIGIALGGAKPHWHFDPLVTVEFISIALGEHDPPIVSIALGEHDSPWHFDPPARPARSNRCFRPSALFAR